MENTEEASRRIIVIVAKTVGADDVLDSSMILGVVAGGSCGLAGGLAAT